MMSLRVCVISLLLWIQLPSQAQSEVLKLVGLEYVAEGYVVYLECDYTGDLSSIHFYKGLDMEELVESEGSVSIDPLPNSVRVLLYDAKQSDGGLYSCGEDRSNVKTFVVHIVDDGTVLHATGTEQVWPGCPITVECEIIGDRTQVNWFKDGVIIEAKSDETWPHPVRLLVENPTTSDSGQYECRTPINSTGTIHVQVWEEEGPVVKIDGTGHVAVGCSIRLECEVEADPHLVTWYKDDEAVDPQLVTGYCDSTRHSTLRIDSAARSDAGQYECRTYAGNSQSFHVHVAEGEIVVSGETMLQEGDPLELSCEVFGYVECIQYWWKDGEVIYPYSDEDINVTSIQISNNTARTSLSIASFTAENAGWYTCGIPDGNSHSFRVDIGKVGNTMVRISGTQYVVEGGSIKLHCEVEGTSPSHVTWYRDTSRMRSGVTHFTQDGTLMSFFKTRATMRAAGTYYCHTPNGDTASITVHVFEGDRN